MSKAGLLDAVGNLVVEYSYDAWGKPIAVTGGMADTVGKLNPFRYRGYVWDEETGLYYLQSRYYNPDWGRFVSADAVVGEFGAVCANNMYAYCKNRPVVQIDDNGQWGISIGLVNVVAGAWAFLGAGGAVLGGALVGGLAANAINGIRKNVEEFHKSPVYQQMLKDEEWAETAINIDWIVNQEIALDTAKSRRRLSPKRYYLAVVNRDTGKMSAFMYPPMDLHQAHVVLEEAYVIQVGLENNPHLQFGIYTPTKLAAEKLATTFRDPLTHHEPHVKYDGCDYYAHYMVAGQHIWYGAPHSAR